MSRLRTLLLSVSLLHALFATPSASAFPVGPLDLGKLYEEIKTGPPSLAKDTKITMEILPHLRTFFSDKAHAIVVQPGDMTGLSMSLPDEQLDDTCSHKVTGEHPVAHGEILQGTSMMFGVSKIKWQDVEIFADAELDLAAVIDLDAKIEVGKSWSAFGKHHCTKIGQKTVGLEVKSQGKVSFGMNASCSNARIEKAAAGKTGFDLVFTFKVEQVAMVMPDWDSSVDASRCKLEILGVKLLSYCGLVERKVQSAIAQEVLKVNTVSAPVIAQRLEEIIQTKIGSEVRIPLIHLPTDLQAQEGDSSASELVVV